MEKCKNSIILLFILLILFSCFPSVFSDSISADNLTGLPANQLINTNDLVDPQLEDETDHNSSEKEYYDLDRTSKGEDVVAIQEKLTELGYYFGLTSGKFDAETRKAMKLFEKANGLPNDGNASCEDQIVLFSGEAVPNMINSFNSAITPTPIDSMGSLPKSISASTSEPLPEPTPEPKDYGVEVTCNCWSASSSWGSNTLYVPYLKLSIKNLMSKNASKVRVQVVFYDESEKSVWSDETDYLVSSSDASLAPGYSKTSFIKSSVGYRSQISDNLLPNITAEIYINEDYYGQISICKTYSETSVSLPLSDSSISSSNAFFGESNEPFVVSVTSACWEKHTSFGQTLYVPKLKIDVTNQQPNPEKSITVKVSFINDTKHELWDDDTSYLVSSSDSPLKSGYKKTAYINSSVGYAKQVSESLLPSIFAEIYVNDVYYGKVDIIKTYNDTLQNIMLSPSVAKNDLETGVAVNVDEPCKVTLIANCWAPNKSLSGSVLYTPYLKFDILNQSGQPIKKMNLKVVFYDNVEKLVWADASDYVISSSDTPLRHGFSKTAFIRSSVGYKAKVSESDLPSLTADVYLDDKLIGEVAVAPTYSETTLSDFLRKPSSDDSSRNTASISSDTPIALFATENCWSESSGLYTPYLIIKAVNQQGYNADKIKIKVVFNNISEKTVWSEESDYLISSNDTPLKNGYGKQSFIRSSVGYKHRMDTSALPEITAEVYLNDKLYGELSINRTYSESYVSEPIPKTEGKAEESPSVSIEGKPYSIEYIFNGWEQNTSSFGGDSLYVPFLKMKVTNQQSVSADKLKMHVVFKNEDDKTIWSDEQYSLISYDDTVLKSGYSKTAFVHSSVGYEICPSVSNLPNLSAEIFINDELFDTVTINRQF